MFPPQHLGQKPGQKSGQKPDQNSGPKLTANCSENISNTSKNNCSKDLTPPFTPLKGLKTSSKVLPKSWNVQINNSDFGTRNFRRLIRALKGPLSGTILTSFWYTLDQALMMYLQRITKVCIRYLRAVRTHVISH